jgi:hypothetical protein
MTRINKPNTQVRVIRLVPTMSNVDHYTVLGVLPDAEDVVIGAAYRALAQRYHPDRWRGDPDEAHRRMSEIDAAYAVVGDQEKRCEYVQRSHSAARQADYSQSVVIDQQSAFTSALDEAEDRWKIACSVFPDLKDLRAHLSQISTGLAFAFVMQCLDTKAFGRRVELAGQLEKAFLRRYFGNDASVMEYAKFLILNGRNEAARWLNRLVEVIGSEVDAELLIAQVDDQFGFTANREAAKRSEYLANLCPNVLEGSFYDAQRLARYMGYRVDRVGGGFFKVEEVEIESPDGSRERFKTPDRFVEWAQQHFCRANRTPN